MTQKLVTFVAGGWILTNNLREIEHRFQFFDFFCQTCGSLFHKHVQIEMKSKRDPQGTSPFQII